MKNTVKQITAATFLAILLFVGNTNAKGTEVKKLDKTIETSLDVENWMIDASVWDIKSSINYEIVQVAETNLELEYWMTSEKTWNFKENSIDETEAQLIVEDWMVKDNIWNRE